MTDREDFGNGSEALDMDRAAAAASVAALVSRYVVLDVSDVDNPAELLVHAAEHGARVVDVPPPYAAALSWLLLPVAGLVAEHDTGDRLPQYTGEAELRSFAQQHDVAQGASAGTRVWNALREAGRTIALAKEYLPEVTKNPPPDGVLRTSAGTFLVHELTMTALLDLHFVPNSAEGAANKPGLWQLDVLSLRSMLQFMLADGYRNIPGLFRTLGPKSLSFLAAFVNDALPSEEPLPVLSPPPRVDRP